MGLRKYDLGVAVKKIFCKYQITGICHSHFQKYELQIAGVKLPSVLGLTAGIYVCQGIANARDRQWQ